MALEIAVAISEALEPIPAIRSSHLPSRGHGQNTAVSYMVTRANNSIAAELTTPITSSADSSYD